MNEYWARESGPGGIGGPSRPDFNLGDGAHDAGSWSMRVLNPVSLDEVDSCR